MKFARWSEARSLFEELVDLDEDARRARLDDMDAELAGEVRELLRTHDSSDRILEPPTGGELEESGSSHAVPDVPQRIGTFRLRRAIGRGGMGTVYEAEQSEPRRVVALKVMRTGLESEAAVRRFRFESEVLARLQHPGIAQVYEAGTHEDEHTGLPLPWFAMELVPSSTPLDRYSRALDLEARLRLFLLVCEAVHYGHQKGVIHRDLKASNILVNEHGEPKVIDFGIARTTGADTATPRFTLDGEIVGTLGSMSPEQLKGSYSDLDTRADVYALGALLYELITDRPPFDLDDTPLPQVIRRLCEERPPRPGVVQPGLPPELDWIVLQAMELERDDRYGSASELAADLERFLVHEPVLAGRPSTAYRVRKFVRRHRLSVAGTVALLAGLVAALVWITSIYVRADRERDKAVAIHEFLARALSSADPHYDGPDARVVDVLDRSFELSASAFEDQPEVRAALLSTVGVTYRGLGQYDRSRDHLVASVELFREAQGMDSADAFVALRYLGATLLADEQDLEAAENTLREAHEGLRATVGDEADETLCAQNSLGLALAARGEYEEAERHLRASLAAYRSNYGDTERTTIRFTGELAHFLDVIGSYEEAEELFRRALASQEELSGVDSVDALMIRNNYSGLLIALDRPAEALEMLAQAHQASIQQVGVEHPLTLRLAHGRASTMLYLREFATARELFTETLETLLQVRGELHPLTLDTRQGLGTVLYYLGNYDDAEEQLRIAMEGIELRFGAEDERVLSTRNNLAMMLQARGRIDEAEELLGTNLEVRRQVYGDLHPDTLSSMGNLGFLLLNANRYEDALPLLEEALAGRREVLGPEHLYTLNSVINLADLYQRLERYAEAIPLWVEVLDGGQEAYANDPGKLDFAARRRAEAEEAEVIRRP